MIINDHDAAARDIIETAHLTTASSRDAIYSAIDAYCDDPIISRMTMHRIYIRICQQLDYPNA